MNRTMLNNRIFEIVLVSVLVIVGSLAHGANMFRFPYYEDDEGTYMSQAWSLATSGKLAPYTYTYDHSPVGWILIYLWTSVTGGFFTFGTAVNSGRAFMFVLNALSIFLLYVFAKRLTRSPIYAAITVLLFSLSPLSIYFHRRVLLDNIMTFLLLLSMTFAVSTDKVIRYLLSAVSFGLAALAKESGIVFLLPMLYLVYISDSGLSGARDLIPSKIADKLKGPLLWGIISGLIISLYPVYAFAKGELTPSQSDTGISLLGTLQTQANRGAASILDVQHSLFWESFGEWIKTDPLLVYLGFASLAFILLLSIKDVRARVISLFGLFYVLFLMRGGLVFEFYLVPLIPFFALSISYVLYYIHTKLPAGNISYAPYALALIFVLIMQFYYAPRTKNTYNIYATDQTASQIDAIRWMLINAPPASKNVIDNYAFVDLNALGGTNGRRFDYYWKVDTDPSIENGVYGGNYKNISYVLLTPQMLTDIQSNPSTLSLTSAAYSGSKKVKEYKSPGWNVQLRFVNKK